MARQSDSEFDTRRLKPAHLRRIRSLATMTEGQLERFFGYVRFFRCGANEEVCREDEAAESMFLILQGQMRIMTEGRRGRPYFLRYLEPGDSFGQIALLDGGKRSATVEATKESLLLEFDREGLERLMAEEPVLASQFLRRIAVELGGQLRDLTNRLAKDGALQQALRPMF